MAHLSRRTTGVRPRSTRAKSGVRIKDATLRGKNCGCRDLCVRVVGMLLHDDRPGSSLRSTIDFGPPETVHLCVFLDQGITEARARELLSSWDSEAPKYGLTVEPVSFRPLAR